MHPFKFIFRNMTRNRVYSLINITGLTIALAATLLIYSHVVKEWKTDRFHTDGKNIYRVTVLASGAAHWSSEVCSPLGEYARKEIPGIKDYVRVVAPKSYLVKTEAAQEFLPEKKCVFADPQLFSVFSFPLRSGHIAPDAKGWVVLSPHIAQKYFGDTPPEGKLMTFKAEGGGEGLVVRVTAVMEKIPAWSSIQADIILDFSVTRESYEYGGGNVLCTFLQLDSNADIARIEKAIPPMEARLSEYHEEMEQTVRLQSLREMYLHSGHIRDYEAPFKTSSAGFNTILGGITLLVLLLASANYMIIKMAQLHKSSQAFSIQKYLGANSSQIRLQLLTEIAIHVAIALALSTGLAYLLHPYFVSIISPQQPYAWRLNALEGGVFILLALLFTGSIGTLLNVWLQRLLSRGNSNQATGNRNGWADVKQNLMIGQMVIFCALLFCSILLARQMNFVRNTPTGFDNRNVLCIEWNDAQGRVKAELLQNPDITRISNGRVLPIGNVRKYDIHTVSDPDGAVESSALLGDADYLETYNIRLLEGRNYTKKGIPAQPFQWKTEIAEVVINREMSKKLGLKNPVGTVLDYGPGLVQVVGVVEDFHYESLYHPVRPLIIGANLIGADRNLCIRYQPGKRQAVADYLRDYHKANLPQTLFRFSEYQYSDLYAKDVAFTRMINLLTLIAIFIGGMGILAFSVFMAESRTKEVAMRKINGATEWQIIRLFNKGFTRKVVLACAIGLPAAHYAMTRWLEGFAYKITPDWYTYAGVTAACIVIVATIVSWQTWNAATRNPVDVLKKT